MYWKDKLNKIEKKHLRENGITNTRGLRAMDQHTKDTILESDEKYPEFPYIGVCFDCIHILIKLGYNPYPTKEERERFKNRRVQTVIVSSWNRAMAIKELVSKLYRTKGIFDFKQPTITTIKRYESYEVEFIDYNDTSINLETIKYLNGY